MGSGVPDRSGAAEAGLPSTPSADRAPSGRKRRAGRTGRGSSAAALGHLPTAWHLARALPQTPAGRARRSTLGVLVPRPGDAADTAASSQAGPGGGALRAGSPGSSSHRGPNSRPLARQANHRGPMTTKPDPSRPGPRETTERESEAALLLSPPPPLHQQLPGSAETPAHLSFPQRPALRDGT